MKKTLFSLLGLCLSTFVFAQTNTFPTSGNTGIGTTGPNALLDIKYTGSPVMNIYRATDLNGQYRWRLDQNFEMFLTNSAGLDVLKLGQTGSYFSSGNVGIGISSPAAKLHVSGDNAEFRLTGGTYNAIRMFDAGTGDPGYIETLYNGTVDGSIGAGATYFAATTGNVGIGTTTADQKLVVNGKIAFDYGDTHSYSGLFLNGLKTEYYNGITSGSTSVIHEFTGSNTTIMSLTQGGSVGIGTSSPATKLHVSGDNAEFRLTGGTYNAIRMFDAGTGDPGYIETLYNGTVDGSIGAGATYFAATTGNVGIGTTTADQKLVVNGKIAFDYGDTHSYSGLFLNGLKTEYYNGITGGSTSVIHEFTGSNTTIMSLTQGGNVGIGTTSPSEKLSVDGTVLAKKVRVSITGWPDYVFNPNYELRSLSELENYIQTNQHLPEVPSATEVEANGLDLGDMDATLLKKVEELTLYTIEQEKKIQNQAASYEELKTMFLALKKEIGQLKKDN